MNSVFDRLGGLKDVSPKREIKGPELQYVGVFKSPRNKPTSKPVLNILKSKYLMLMFIILALYFN